MTTWKVVTDTEVDLNYFQIMCQLGRQSRHKIIFDGHSQIAINANFDRIIDLDQKSQTYARENHLTYRSQPSKLVSYYPNMTNLCPFHIGFLSNKKVATVTNIKEETDFGKIITHCVNSYDQLMKHDLWNQEFDVVFGMKPTLFMSSNNVLLLRVRTEDIFFKLPNADDDDDDE